MASVFADITNHLLTTLNGLTLTYKPLVPMTWEAERLIVVKDSRYPYGVVSGPTISSPSEGRRGHGVVQCELNYLLTFMDDTIEDGYDPDVTVSPITIVAQDVIRDIWTRLMLDRTRGARAINTEVIASGHYFDDDGDTPLFNIYLQLLVTTVVRDTDPNYTGG